jgi:DNA-binding transcriptional LysR family regulator
MAFVAASSHALLRSKCIHLAELESADLLVMERGSGTRVAVKRLFKDAGLKLQLALELSSNEAIKQLAGAGLAVAFLSLNACALEMQAGILATLPVPSTPIERAWNVVHMSERRLHQFADAFHNFLIESGAASSASTRLPAKGEGRTDHKKPKKGDERTIA